MRARTGTLGLAAVIFGGAWGCGATGLAWVHEPESGVDLSAPPPTPSHAGRFRSLEAVPAAAITPTTAAPSRRIDRTITLGEVTTLDSRSSSGAVDARPATIVNVYVTSPAPMSPYANPYGFGYGVAIPSFGAARTVAVQQAAPALRPGLDWPAVANPGSSFPYRTAPAPPWNGDVPRRR